MNEVAVIKHGSSLMGVFFSDIDPDINLKLKNDINIIELGYISETKFKVDMHTWRNMKSNI